MVSKVWWAWGDLETDLKDKKFGYKGRKDKDKKIIEEGSEWAVSQSLWQEGSLKLEHSQDQSSFV